MAKETFKRDLLSPSIIPEACQDVKRDPYIYAERKQTCQRDLLSLYDMPEACQDVQEMYVHAQEDVYTCKKRPVNEIYLNYTTYLRHFKISKERRL